APTITASSSGQAYADAHSGWNNTDVTVTYAVVEANVDATASDYAPDVLTASGTATGTVTDLAGNVATVSYQARIDKTAPVITLDPYAQAAWYTQDMTVSYSTGDGSSGLACASTGSHTFAQGANQSYTFTVIDVAGNTNSVTVHGINVDKAAPTTGVS